MNSRRRRASSASPHEEVAEKDRKRSRQSSAERGTGQRAARGHGGRRPILLSGLLIASTLLVYGQTAGFDFVALDDPTYVTGNIHVQGGLTWPNVVWSFSKFHDANWIPLTWLSLMLDTGLFGLRPSGYHLTNVALHVANTLLLFAFLVRATGNQIRSAIVAALFALHPLHVESVAWITERKDVLSTFFGLLALLTYVNYALGRRIWNLAASLACLVLSLMTKQTLVTLPFVFLLLDFWPLRRWGWKGSWLAGQANSTRTDASPSPEDAPGPAGLSGTIRPIAEKIPFFVVSLLFSVVALRAQTSGHAVLSLESVPLSIRCQNVIGVYATYLWKALLPHDLAAYYPLSDRPFAWFAIVGSGILLAVITIVAIARLRRSPYLFVGWSWYLGTLVPMIGLVQIGTQQMADRYTYFPLIGPFMAVVWLIAELVPPAVRQVPLWRGAVAATLAAFAATTFVQVGYWRDSITLFRHTVAVVGDNTFAMSALAHALLTHGQTAEGYAVLQSVTRKNPHDPLTLYNIAVGLQQLGRPDEAADYYRSVLAMNDNDADAHTNLGVIDCQRGQYAKGKAQFLRAIDINPEQVQAYVNLGMLYVETGQYDQGVAASQRALELDPHLLDCHINIGVARRAQGRFDEALDQFNYVLARSPRNADAQREQARTLQLKSRSSR
jgi:protein O-mannosyl-transferase